MTSRRFGLSLAACLPLMAAACYGSHPGEPIADGGESSAVTGGGGHRPAGGKAGSSGNAGHGGSGQGAAADGDAASASDAGDATPENPLDAGDASTPTSPASTEPNLRVAFLGDQGVNDNARAVLALVKSEGAAFVIHAGDIGYGATPAAWEAMIDAELGSNFPYFIAIGNHDVPDWLGSGGFQARSHARLLRTKGAQCFGDLGVSSRCSYRGLVFVLSGVGSYGTDHEAYLDRALATRDVFRLCIWHKNQHDMQTEVKVDEVGWAAYQVCQAHGAPIITGHAHSYSRTYTLQDVGNALADHGMLGQPDALELAPGHTSVFVTALAGASTRTWNGEDNAWWATIYTGNYQRQNAAVTGTSPSIEYGALFIDFHVDDDPYLARGYFKTTSGQVQDTFTLHVTP